MHAAYIISTSVRNTFYKRNKKLVRRTLLSYISTWDFLRTLEKIVSSTSLVFFKTPRVLIELNNALSAFFITLIVHPDNVSEQMPR